jgi:hypothetical protein
VCPLGWLETGAEGVRLGMIETEKILRRPEGDQTSCLEKRYALTEKKGFANVVCYEDDSLIEAMSQCAEFALKLGAGDRVESAEGLIHEQDGRVGGEGACDPNALPLAARKLARMPTGKFGGIETN